MYLEIQNNLQFGTKGVLNKRTYTKQLILPIPQFLEITSSLLDELNDNNYHVCHQFKLIIRPRIIILITGFHFSFVIIVREHAVIQNFFFIKGGTQVIQNN